MVFPQLVLREAVDAASGRILPTCTPPSEQRAESGNPALQQAAQVQLYRAATALTCTTTVTLFVIVGFNNLKIEK